MTMQEIKEKAKDGGKSLCKACPICNGRACGTLVPGPGSKGIGDTAIRNYDAWKKIRINMDTIGENIEPDTSFDFFGYKMKYPIFAGPIGAIAQHYSDQMNDMQYNDILVSACAKEGILAFTGDGVIPEVMDGACKAIKAQDGKGIPTVKPWDTATIESKFEQTKASGCLAVAMDIDAAGLPFLRNMALPAGSKTAAELSEIVQKAGKPFIVKGVMTADGAKKAIDAGAAGIIVSNHGGRVLDQCPATAEVLYEIARAVSGRCKILVDGGIRTGTDIFKALCLGADAVIIARPYVTMVLGGGEEGVALYTSQIGAELSDAMKMCGAVKLSDLSEKYLYKPSNPYIIY